MLLRNIQIATMADAKGSAPLRNGVIALDGDRIGWVGDASNLPDSFAGHDRIDLGGRLVTPGLIDCHTHIVHGGNRAKEFELRLTGASYEDISRAGGGIASTVCHTRAASFDALLASALPRVDALIAEGVTLIEVKSGYGLDTETELKMLRVAREIEGVRPIRVRTSFLGAHATPPGDDISADTYIDDICIPTLRAACAEGLVDAVDGFCERIAFTPDQIARVFDVARVLGLPVKLHAEQLSHMGGTSLAARYNALSADHVEYATKADAAALGHSGTVAVLLPGAFYTLGETQIPPVDAFRSQSVPMALATDCNPGSSPMTSLLLSMNMACTLFRLTPAEALMGVTAHAATALGETDCGRIQPGYRADLAVWDVDDPAELAYRIGFNPLYQRIFGGRL